MMVRGPILQLLVMFQVCAILCQKAPDITQLSSDCIGCICEGSSTCKRDTKCLNGSCGAFRITLNYWKDAGAPKVVGRSDASELDAWEACALDLECSAQAVISYMDKYKQDCNNDGVIDCQDYGRLHNLGPGCVGPFRGAYRFYFNRCYRLLFEE